MKRYSRTISGPFTVGASENRTGNHQLPGMDSYQMLLQVVALEGSGQDTENVFIITNYPPKLAGINVCLTLPAFFFDPVVIDSNCYHTYKLNKIDTCG